MEENKSTNKLNNVPADLPKVPRDQEGKILIDEIATGKDDKGRYIVPDEIFDAYFRELPQGTKNASGTWRASCNGKLKILGVDPADAYIHRRGAEASNATQAQRRTNKEVIEILYKQRAPKEVIERLGLKPDATVLEAVNAAQLAEAMKGSSKAYEVIRDTAGEKPTEQISAEITAVTPEDQELMKRVAARLDSNT